MGNKLDKFLLLMWKNFLLQWRHPLQTIIEILSPIIFTLVLVILRALVQPERFPASFFLPFENKMANASNFRSTIIWSPTNVQLCKVMDETVQAINILHNVTFFEHKSVKNYTELDFQLTNGLRRSKVFAGVAFSDNYMENVTLFPNVSVILRFFGESAQGLSSWETDKVFPIYYTPGVRSRRHNEGGPPGYRDEGFLMLQEQLSYSIINYFKQNLYNTTFNRSSVPIYMQRLPYPKYTEDVLLSALDIFIGIVIMLSFIYPCINIVKAITTEKEKQLKETMKIMGLPNWLHWTAWFCKSFVLIFIATILIVTLLKVRWYQDNDFTIFTSSDPTLLLVFLALFSCSTITFSFAISSLFTKANVATTIAGIAWFLSYAPYVALQYKYDNLSLTIKLLSSIFSNTAVTFGFKLIIKMENTGNGLHWNNIWNLLEEENLMFGHILIMLFVDAVLYLCIAIYVETVFPGDYGVAQPWYFVVTPSYWCGNRTHVIVDECNEPNNSEYHEKDPDYLHPGIKIKGLRKVYCNKRVAVRNLSMNMYKDQITILLGHNGAGKTTMISMLTGLLTPTNGTAIINGHDIRNNMESVRAGLGICPQHNILFDELTVQEHLYFYSRLKGVPKLEVNSEIFKFLHKLELTQKKNTQAGQLSGGTKRKLSVGLAFCGRSDVVLCDEPSAGMDPSARRALWDLLLSQKKGRTILLTTHLMDEADLLGDKIAIMAGGKLECSGSSFFLKKKYGAGYHLILDKLPDCDVSKITELLGKYIENLTVHSNIGFELTYVLNEEHSNVFENMLRELEVESSNFGIRSYGIALTTLEEVFMKVGADHGQEEENNASEFGHINPIFRQIEQVQTEIQNSIFSIDGDVEPKLIKSWELWRNQIMAMFLKKTLSIIRSWILLVIQIVTPVIFLIITFIIMYDTITSGDPPMIKIRLNRYVNPVTLISLEDLNEYYSNYINMLDRDCEKYIICENQTLSDRALEEAEKDITNYNGNFITGVSFQADNSIIAWFSNQPYHGPPLALQLTINSIFHTEVSSEHNIQIYHHPIPFSIESKFKDLYSLSNIGYQLAFNLGFSMALVSAFYVMFYIRERSSKFKHLQFVSGVEVLSFWIPSFVCDMLTFVLTSTAVIITLVVFQEDGFKTGAELGRIFAIMLAFSFGSLPMMYLASYLCNVPSSGYTKVGLFNIIFGTGAFVVVDLFNTKGLDLEHIAEVLHWIFLFIPHYAFSAGLRDMNVLYSIQHLCETVSDSCKMIELKNLNTTVPPLLCDIFVCLKFNQCCEKTEYFALSFPGIGKNVIITCCMGLLFFMVLLLIEYSVFEKIRNVFQLHYPYLQSKEDEDEDVFMEKSAIMHDVSIGNISKYNLAMHNISKNYNDLVAVNNISLGVNKKECFGLLGVNGAGKTTTFKMMTGDLKIQSGDAWINGWSIKTDLKKVYQLIGYCPQFDALLDDLTCKETLVIFGLLRGVPRRKCAQLAETLGHEFDFTRHLCKQVKELSGGNKRKLSTALALVGDPLVLYLDEPTAGVDPATRRHIWNTLCKVRDKGKAIVLTSHSMEECEALCTRIAIMVNGSFKCLGSIQHLKNKFSEGYTLTVKAKTLDDAKKQHFALEKIEEFVRKNFINFTVREKHHEMITFYISDRCQPCSRMFGIIERGKSLLPIEGYSLSQCSLEQVFLTFARLQREE
ncbi:hypothetical protein FQA39_LY13354 [Lamprigera yunnana]|nr:hypothetical protein FQA39_LY13354 [Lamprigera yunnana]